MRGASFYERKNFDEITLVHEHAVHDSHVAASAAFALAMGKAIAKGKERDRRGTFVDTTPPINAVRIVADQLMSSCGSPGAMCAESGARGDGAQNFR